MRVCVWMQWRSSAVRKTHFLSFLGGGDSIQKNKEVVILKKKKKKKNHRRMEQKASLS